VDCKVYVHIDSNFVICDPGIVCEVRDRTEACLGAKCEHDHIHSICPPRIEPLKGSEGSEGSEGIKHRYYRHPVQ